MDNIAHQGKRKEQKREKIMKKYLIIAFVICMLLLAGCSSHAGAGTAASPSTAQTTGSFITASKQNACQDLRDQQTLLSQQYNIASSAAQNHGGPQYKGDEVKKLSELQRSITQMQAQLRLCYKNAG